MSCALEVEGLWKSYAVGVRGCSARISVLRGASFRVARGERVAIVGARGAGKTTLFHCIAGLRRPDAGWVRVSGPAAESIRVLDDALAAPGAPPLPASVAVLMFAREPARLDGQVDRVLLLRDGLVVPAGPPLGAAADGRRVAEP